MPRGLSRLFRVAPTILKCGQFIYKQQISDVYIEVPPPLDILIVYMISFILLTDNASE